MFIMCLIALSSCAKETTTNENPEKPADENKVELIKASGTYVGQVDPHTIEIEFEDGAKAFQITEDQAIKIKELQTGAGISIQYVKNDKGQLELKELKVNQAESKEVTGTFNGLVDPHTVEIELADGPQAFQISAEQASIFKSIAEGTGLKFQYDDQLTLKDIVIEETGKYVGQADPHTVEIETATGPQAFQLNDTSKAEIEKLQDGDVVNIQYMKNNDGQLVLLSITKRAAN